MDKELVKALLDIGFTKQDIDGLPLPFKLSELMASKKIKEAHKKTFYPSELHGTKRLPQNKYYKKVSNMINLIYENE